MTSEAWRLRLSLAATATLLACAAAHADVTISKVPTQNMNCSGGVCAPTAADAVLNVDDLETMLASGNVTVTTTGSGVEATSIAVNAPFSWSATSMLTLQAYQSIAVAKHISVSGSGGLTIVTNNGGSGGTFYFAPTGRASFADLSSALIINGDAYALVSSVESLANSIADNSSGNYALADNYDASRDGRYSNTPITTILEGRVEGLGNVIRNITVVAKPKRNNVGGLFSFIDAGTVENLGIENLRLKAGRYEHHISQNGGGMTIGNGGTMFNDHVSGTVYVDATNSDGGSQAGGLAAINGGLILNCYSTAQISGNDIDAGGLVGGNLGRIYQSFATGSVTGLEENDVDYLGGLTEGSDGSIVNSYATGAVKGESEEQQFYIGGLTGDNSGVYSIDTSYSIGLVTGSGALIGGFMGDDVGSASDDYWDTQTSGTDQGTADGNASGVTGLTTKQFKKGLPSGFDPSIWAQDKNINHGFPYLISNPPPEK